MPSAGKPGFSWNGRQVTIGGGASGRSLAYSASAPSSRRLPMKHHGQTTSETTSIVSGIACSSRGPDGDRVPRHGDEIVHGRDCTHPAGEARMQLLSPPRGSPMSYPSGRHFLQIPGPTNVPDRVLRAIDMPTMDHRGPEFGLLGLEVLDGLKHVFQTKQQVVIYPA